MECHCKSHSSSLVSIYEVAHNQNFTLTRYLHQLTCHAQPEHDSGNAAWEL